MYSTEAQAKRAAQAKAAAIGGVLAGPWGLGEKRSYTARRIENDFVVEDICFDFPAAGLSRHERAALLFEAWLEEKEIDFTKRGVDSIYFHTEYGTVRFADHAQGPHGGYSGDGEGYYGKPEWSVEPDGAKVAQVKRELLGKVREEA